MSNNPYVTIDRVIDTRDNQRRIVDFLHQRTFTNTNIYANRFAATSGEEVSDGAFYVDIAKSELTIDSTFILKENHMPIIILSTHIDLTIHKDNFPTCKTVLVGDQVFIRLYARVQPLQRLDIPVIMVVEVES